MNPLYVTADRLNGRASPNKHSDVEARFDRGDDLIPTGQWSSDHCWIEVRGGETGTVWVNIKYVTERIDDRYMRNDRHNKVKVRSHPVNGKVRGYIKKGEQIELTQIVLGWGRIDSGWVELAYFD